MCPSCFSSESHQNLSGTEAPGHQLYRVEESSLLVLQCDHAWYEKQWETLCLRWLCKAHTTGKSCLAEGIVNIGRYTVMPRSFCKLKVAMPGKVGEVFLLLQPNTHPENGCEDCFSSLLVTSSLEESLAGT